MSTVVIFNVTAVSYRSSLRLSVVRELLPHLDLWHRIQGLLQVAKKIPFGVCCDHSNSASLTGHRPDPSPPPMADQELVDKFILQEIDSVPHLEALLLFWRQRPKQWCAEELAHALYVSEEIGEQILRDLSNRSLITAIPGQPGLFAINCPSAEKEQMLESLDRTYRRELIRVTRMIHSKASPAVRDFARAFRFKREDT